MASDAAKVGVFVVLALLLTAGIYLFLNGSFLRPPMVDIKADFENAQGITRGTMVRMAGVNIGEVTDVKLDPETKRAVVTMKIQRQHTPTGGDRFTIATGGLLPAPTIEIVPAAQTPVTGTFHGTSPVTIDQLMPQAQSLVVSLRDLSQSLEKVVGDRQLMNNLKASAASMATLSKRGERIAANLEVTTARGPRIMASFERAGRTMEASLSEVRGALGENRARLAALLDQSRQAVEAMQETLVETRRLIADEQTRENLRATVANLREMTATLREATTDLRKTAGDVQSLTGDPKVQTDLRETLAGARQTMDEAQRLLHRINQIVGSGGEKTAGARQRLRDTEMRLDVQEMSSPGRPRIDVNATVPGARGRFTQFGLYDFGESTKFNFQFGRPVGDTAALRYGLHASRLGLGLDWAPRGSAAMRPRLSADLYGLDDTRLDLRLAAPLSRTMDLTFGVDRLFQSASPAVGVRWHR